MPLPAYSTLSSDARKILKTLYIYQQKEFGHNTYSRNKRWTFTIAAESPNYQSFNKGLSELFRYGLVDLAPGNGQIMLSSRGLENRENFIGLIEDEEEEYFHAD